MKLYLLRPLNYDHDDFPEAWKPWYDKSFGFVVRAETECDARKMAAEKCGDEGADAWTDPELSDCSELCADGESAIIMKDFAAA